MCKNGSKTSKMLLWTCWINHGVCQGVGSVYSALYDNSQCGKHRGPRTMTTRALVVAALVWLLAFGPGGCSVGMASCFHPMTHGNEDHWVFGNHTIPNTPFFKWFWHWSWDDETSNHLVGLTGPPKNTYTGRCNCNFLPKSFCEAPINIHLISA